jgi:hypothetical protein
MAGGIAYGKEYGLVLPFCPLESFVTPGIPVHRVPGVLQKVRALLAD